MKFSKNTSSAPQIEEGTYVARLYSIIYLGLQEEEWKGEKKSAQKINFTFEIPTETINIGGKNLPRAISSQYTLSFGQKANLPEVIEVLSGKKVTDFEGDIEFSEFIGKTCLIKVGLTSGGKPKITGVSKLMKGQVCEPAVNPTVLFDNQDNFDMEIFNKFPQFIQDKLNLAPEYAGLLPDNLTGAVADVPFD
jgi:hypothetical protein